MDIKLMSRDQQIDFGGNDDEDDSKEAIELGVTSDRDNETPILKDEKEPLVPKMAEKQTDIFKKKTTNEAGMIGRASMKGFMKDDLEGLNNKAKAPSKYEETKGKDAENKKTDDKNEQIMGLDSIQQQAKVPLKTIDQLLIHNSDTAVKPIIGNKDIEKHGELVFNAQQLPFEAWNSE